MVAKQNARIIALQISTALLVFAKRIFILPVNPGSQIQQRMIAANCSQESISDRSRKITIWTIFGLRERRRRDVENVIPRKVSAGLVRAGVPDRTRLSY